MTMKPKANMKNLLKKGPSKTSQRTKREEKPETQQTD